MKPLGPCILCGKKEGKQKVISFFNRYRAVLGTSLAVQLLRLCASSAGGTGSFPDQGTKILHAVQCNQKKTKKKGVEEISKKQKHRNRNEEFLQHIHE